MVFKRLLNSLIFIGFSFLIIGCSATNEQLNEDLVNQKKIYEKEQITPILINEINQIILFIHHAINIKHREYNGFCFWLCSLKVKYPVIPS